MCQVISNNTLEERERDRLWKFGWMNRGVLPSDWLTEHGNNSLGTNWINEVNIKERERERLIFLMMPMLILFAHTLPYYLLSTYLYSIPYSHFYITGQGSIDNIFCLSNVFPSHIYTHIYLYWNFESLIM